MKLELVNLSKKLQEEYNNFHESLFKLRRNDLFETVEVYGIDVDLKASTLDNLEDLMYEIQDELLSLDNDNRLKHWVSICHSLCEDVIDLIFLDGNIYQLPNFIVDSQSFVVDDELHFNHDNTDSNLKVKEETALDILQLQLVEAEEEVLELEEKIKQLMSLLLGLSF